MLEGEGEGYGVDTCWRGRGMVCIHAGGGGYGVHTCWKGEGYGGTYRLSTHTHIIAYTHN